MSERLILWGRGTSSNVQRVIWACAEAGLAPERRIVGGPHGGLDTPAFTALSPAGTISVLQDGAAVVWQAHAILRHLGRRHALALYPEDPVQRAEVDSWLDWVATVFWPPVRDVFVRGWLGGEADLAELHAKIADSAQRLDAVLAQQPFLGGDEFSMADITAGVAINRHRTMGLTLPGAALSAWFERLAARPGFTAFAGEEQLPPRADSRPRVAAM
ncbi:MAG: glutathione S-transferase family protein [Pseudomonadota bacterium]